MEIDELESYLQEVIRYSNDYSKNFSFPLEVPNAPNPLNLCKWYAKEVETINNEINNVESKFHITCKCKRGCSFCCNQLIVISKTELIILDFTLHNFPNELRKRIYDMCVSQCNILTQHNITQDVYERAIVDKAAQQSLQEKYFSLNIPCPLLNLSHECSIYHVRPTVCWSYRNYDSNEHCIKTPFTPTAIKYSDWELLELVRLYKARNTRKPGDLILQFAIKSLFENH